MSSNISADQAGGPGLAYPPNKAPELEPWMERVRITLEELLAFAVSQQAPYIMGGTVSIDDNGNVDVVLKGNPNLESVRIATSTSSFPSKTTTQGATSYNTDDNFTVEVTGITTVSPGDTIYVSALGYNEEDAGGQESEDLQKAKATMPIKEAGISISEDATQSGTTGSLDLTIEDPDTQVTAVEFQKKTDFSGFGGSWLTSWDRSTGTVGNDSTLTRGEDITMSEKHNVAIKYRVQWTDSSGNSRTESGTVEFDVDQIAELNTLTATIQDDGEVTVSAGGDDDTASVDIWVGENSDPNTGTTPDATISARKGSVDTGVTISEGSDAHVFAAGVDSNSNRGPEKETKAHRGTPDPDLEDFEITSVVDDGTDVTYNTSWTPNSGVNNTDHDLVLDHFENGTFVGQTVITDPASTTTNSFTDSGAGDGSSSDTGEVKAKLKSSNGVIASYSDFVKLQAL